jgi:ligand-binding sensor domain-containing protein
MGKHLLVVSTLLGLLLAACADGTPTPAPMPVTALGGRPQPSPSAAVPGLKEDTPQPLPSTVVSTTTVATTIAPGWTRYEGINQVYELAFAPDGTLWAITNGGLVQWDLSRGTYTRHLIDASQMAVAPDGTLWLGTEGGLCHFDSATCEIYPDPNWAVQGGVRDVAVTADGVVWMSGEGRVSRYDGKSWKSYPFYDPPHDLVVAADGEVWGAIPDGIARYLSDQDAWVVYTGEQGLPNGSPQIIAVTPAGELWVSMTWEGLYRFDGDDWQAVAEPPGGYMGAISFAADGTPWVGTVGGLHYPGGNLAYWDGESWIDVSGEEGLISIRAVVVGPGDVVAAATHLGLGIYQDGQWRLLKDGPTSDGVTSVAVTPDRSVWFAAGDESPSTEGSGLSRFDGESWDYHLGDTEVGALAVAPDGSLWAGTGWGVQRFDGSAWKAVGHGQENLPLGNVLDIAFTPDGAAWVATGFGLATFDGDSWTIHDKLIHSIEAAPDGAIWASGWEGTQHSDYIARFDGAEWTTYRQADSFPGRFTMRVVTPDGLVWGTVPGRGLASFDGRSWASESSWSFYMPPGAPPPENMHLLGIAPDGALWLGLEGGVARFDPASQAAQGAEGNPASAWAFYAAEQGLSSGHVNTIAFGPEGEIWLDTTRFQPAQAGEVSPGP